MLDLMIDDDVNSSSTRNASPNGDVNFNDALIYPNPASDYLVVSTNISYQANDNIEILDYKGRRVMLVSENIRNSNFIDIHILPSGLYICHLKLSDGTSRFLKFSVLK
jgi:hypothetical protein